MTVVSKVVCFPLYLPKQLLALLLGFSLARLFGCLFPQFTDGIVGHGSRRGDSDRPFVLFRLSLVVVGAGLFGRRKRRCLLPESLQSPAPVGSRHECPACAGFDDSDPAGT